MHLSVAYANFRGATESMKIVRIVSSQQIVFSQWYLDRSVSGNSISDHLCYLGVFLQAETWSTCSFILQSNVAEVTSGGFFIRLPLVCEKGIGDGRWQKLWSIFIEMEVSIYSNQLCIYKRSLFIHERMLGMLWQLKPTTRHPLIMM